MLLNRLFSVLLTETETGRKTSSKAIQFNKCKIFATWLFLVIHQYCFARVSHISWNIHTSGFEGLIQNIRVVSDQWIPSRKRSQHKHTNYSPEQLVQWPSCPAALADVKSVGKDLGTVAIGVNLHTCLKRNKAIGYQQDNNMTLIEKATICSLITSKA